MEGVYKFLAADIGYLYFGQWAVIIIDSDPQTAFHTVLQVFFSSAGLSSCPRQMTKLLLVT